jgi:transposase
LGIKNALSKSTLADAAERRDWRLFEALGHRLIKNALALFKADSYVLGLTDPLYAMDSTTIDLCLSLFPWAHFRTTKAAVKAHTLLDIRGAIPVHIAITDGKAHDATEMDSFALQPNATVVFDRGYVDFKRLAKLVSKRVHFVIRAKSNLKFICLSEAAVDESSGLLFDQTIELAGLKSKKDYPQKLRRVGFFDSANNLKLVFFTDRFDLPALTIALIYKERWKIELFFKWLKQHLMVKHFFGNSMNAVKSQIWLSVISYLLLVIAHKKLNSRISLHLFSHLVEANIFENITLENLVASALKFDDLAPEFLQQDLFQKTTGQ